jgi:hypothetical protein
LLSLLEIGQFLLNGSTQLLEILRGIVGECTDGRYKADSAEK